MVLKLKSYYFLRPQQVPGSLLGSEGAGSRWRNHPPFVSTQRDFHPRRLGQATPQVLPQAHQ